MDWTGQSGVAAGGSIWSGQIKPCITARIQEHRYKRHIYSVAACVYTVPFDVYIQSVPTLFFFSTLHLYISLDNSLYIYLQNNKSIFLWSSSTFFRRVVKSQIFIFGSFPQHEVIRRHVHLMLSHKEAAVVSLVMRQLSVHYTSSTNLCRYFILKALEGLPQDLILMMQRLV